jgi:transposase
LGRARRKKLITELQDRPELVVLAEDEAKVYLQSPAQAVWAPKGQTPQVRLDPRNKEAACFYGTLDLRSGNEIVTRSEMMESQATIAHLQAILDAYPKGGILLFWDRAPWHTSSEVQAFLQRNGRIEVVPFPVGAPDLNPQEHVWKAVRRAVEHNHDLNGIGALADAFEAELRSRSFSSSFFVKYGGTVVCPFLE